MKRKRYANGPARPRYLSSADADRAIMMILTLSAEVSALRERLDTHERLAAAQIPAAQIAVDGYQPSEPIEAERARARRALIERLTRVLVDPATGRSGHTESVLKPAAEAGLDTAWKQ